MKKVTLGNKFKNDEYMFRETCFGIYYKDGKLLVGIDNKRNCYTLIGGGIEQGETHETTLKREFLEETGIEINNIKPFVTIDAYWLAENKYPIESLAHIYLVDIDKINDIKHELEYKLINIEDVTFPLPYHQKALELFKETIKK